MRIRPCLSEHCWPLTQDLPFRSSLVARLTQILFRSADFCVSPGLSTRLQASRVPADRPGVSARSAPAPPLPEPAAAKGGAALPRNGRVCARHLLSDFWWVLRQSFWVFLRISYIYFLSTLFLLLLRIRLLYFFVTVWVLFPRKTEGVWVVLGSDLLDADRSLALAGGPVFPLEITPAS